MDTSLKQRLVGAAVLIALAVIFLPMLVNGPAPDSGVSDVPLDIPTEPGASDMQTRDLPLEAPGNVPAGGATGMPSANPEAPSMPSAAGGLLGGFDQGWVLAQAEVVIAAKRQHVPTIHAQVGALCGLHRAANAQQFGTVQRAEFLRKAVEHAHAKKSGGKSKCAAI